MKLSAILPKHSSFNRSQFYAIGGGTKRATLRVAHTVCGTVGAKERIGEANIDYNFDFPKKSTFVGSMVTGNTPYVGVQSTDLLNRALEELRPRTSYSFGKVSKTAFDLRALCFALGAASAIGVGNVDFDVCPTPSGYRSIGTGWSVPDMGDIIFGPEIISTANEFATLMSICGFVGIRSVTILRDDIPGVDGLHLVGRKLAAFAYRVQANILQASFDAMCYGAHKLAFEAGKTVAMRLNAHTDEGGWLRTLLTNPIYPVPVGYVFGTGTHFGALPLQETIMLDDVFRVVMGDYLETVALFPVADVRIHGEHSVIKADVEAPTRPGDYDLLFESLYSVLKEVKNLLCDREGYHRDANEGGGAYAHYVERNAPDRHFGNPAIMPWWFVEPSPLLIESVEGYKVPARHGEVTKLPMFETLAIRHLGGVIDGVGRAGPGSRSFIVRKPTTLRYEGASYLLSPAYSPDDGLAQLRYVESTPAGDQTFIPMFVGDPRDSLAGNRWVTPHNPMPSPMEGRCDLHSALEYRHVSKRTDLTPKEMLTGTVESSFGTFVAVEDSPTAPCVTHRTIPSYMMRRLKLTTATLTPLQTITVVSLGEPAPVTLNTGGPDPTPVHGPVGGGDTTDGPPPDEEQPKPTQPPRQRDDAPIPEAEKERIPLKPAPMGVKPAAKVVKPRPDKKDDESGNGSGVTPPVS